MAMHVPKAPGFAQMLKEGAKHFVGLEEAVIRNIDACKELAKTTRSAYGPNGQNKMVINHIDKLFVTNDAATILRELEIEHPAAKLLVMASQQQEQECGDGTNFVLIFAGALLDHAEDLIRMGLSVTEIIDGYELAMKKAHEILPNLVCGQVKELKDVKEVSKAVRTSIMSKQYGSEDFLAKLIVDACGELREGCGVSASTSLSGMVFQRHVEGDVTKAENCKVAVYSCPLDLIQTETKGTVLIKTAQELLDLSKGEENIMENQIKAIADSGASVVVTGGKVADLALHYANKHNLLVVRLMSKWDLRRLCRAIKATPLPRLTKPTPQELGHCDFVHVDEIGETPIIVFKQEKQESAVSTIVIRGATHNIMDDIERAIDDGVNTFKAMSKDSRLVPGAGATEIELAKQIESYGETCPGLEQYSIKKFAEALEALPRAIAENSGLRATEIIAKLNAAHQEGNKNIGVDIEETGANVIDAAKADIVDLLITKHWGLKFATSATNTVLIVDQIIMAKPAGGPKPKAENKNWDDDE